MQHVKPKWLHLYNYIQAFLDIVIIGLFFAFGYFDISKESTAHWGLVPVTAILSGVHLGYMLVVYPFVRRKNEWIAHALSQMIYGVLIASLVEASGNVNLFYRLAFVVYIFFLNMVGPYLAIAAIALAWILLLMTTLALTTPTNASLLYNIVIDTLVTIGGIGGWFVFRPHYVKKRDQETIELANLLEQEQVKSSVVLESITDGVIVVNTKGTVQIINAAAANMFGWTKEEAARIDYRSLYKLIDAQTQELAAGNPSNVPDVIAQTLQTAKPHQTVTLLGNRRDKQFYADIVASPIMGESVTKDSKTVTKLVGAIVVFRDVDKQKREEQQRTEFISTASHEMRTPVAAIEGYLALAMNDKVCLIDEKARGYLEKAHGSTEHLGQLFQDLLTSAKADDGRLASHPEVVELAGFIEKLIEDLRFAAEKKGLALEYVMGTDQDNVAANSNTTKVIKPLYYVEVDPDRLREVITNLFDNAVKYTPSGKISIGLTGNADVVQLYLKDTGSGIPPEDVPHLFQKFYRVDNTATRTIGGTGLGLFICRKIIELYKGKIWVKSQLGEGSTFFVNLPRLDSAAAEATRVRLANTTQPAPTTPPASPQPAAAPPQPKPTVVQ